jgi:hypothetical protein
VDRHRFDADPDLDRHQNDSDPQHCSHKNKREESKRMLQTGISRRKKVNFVRSAVRIQIQTFMNSGLDTSENIQLFEKKIVFIFLNLSPYFWAKIASQHTDSIQKRANTDENS